MQPYYQHEGFTLYNANALTIAQSLKDGSVHGGIMDPPYFNLCHYRAKGEYGLEDTIAEYLTNMSPVFLECSRVFTIGGCLFLVMGDTSNNYSPVLGKGDRRQPEKAVKRRPLQPEFNEKEQLGVPEYLLESIVTPEDWQKYQQFRTQLNLKLPFLVRELARQYGWKHRHTFIWDKGSCGAQYDPDSDSAPIDFAWVFQLVKFDRGGRLKVNCKPFRSSFFRYSPVSHPLHPCPLPPGLCREIVTHIATPGDTFLDLFAGSGATLKAAAAHGCNVIGNDLNREFCDSIIADFRMEQQELPLHV